MRTWSAPALPPSWNLTGAPPFVARREEQHAVREAYADVVAGAGHTVFVSGAAGTGKSRLLATACTELHARGAAVLAGDCVQEFPRPLEPFDEALAPLLAAMARAAPDADGGRDADGHGDDHDPGDGDHRGAVDTPLAFVRDTLAREAARETVRPTTLTRDAGARPAVGPDRLFDDVLRLLVAASEQRPIVLALDDLHWAGDDAVRLLTRVVGGLANARLLVIGAFRLDPPDRSDTLAATVSRLGHLPGVQHLPLAPFTAPEVVEYLQRDHGLPPRDAGALAGTLMRVTGGNPYLVRTTWRQALNAATRGGPIDLPATAVDLFRPRLALLSARELDTLKVAALLGEHVDVVELLAVAGGTADDGLTAVDAIVAAGLLEPPEQPEGPYRFPHAIARQAVLDLITPSEAMRLHARIAQTLEARFPAAPRLVQRLAHHYGSARALGFADRATTYLIRSAESADARLAHVEAGRMFERAADFTGRADERDQLRVRAARSWSLASDFARARRQHELLMTSEDPRTRLRAAIGYEDASWRPGLAGARSAELLTAALAATAADPHDPLVIEAIGSLGRATAFTGDVDAGGKLGDRAIALARELGDRRTLAATLRARAWHTLRPEMLHTQLALADELVALVADLDEDWVGLAGIVLGHGAYVLGDAEGMDRAERLLAANARRWGAYWSYWIECARFGRSFMTGSLAEARAAVARIGTIERGFRSDATTGAGAVQSFVVRRETGRLRPAAAMLTGTESPTSSWAPGLLALYTELGMVDPARRILHWLLDHDDEQLHRSSDWPARLAFMADAAVAAGDAEASRALRPLLAEYSGLNLMSGFHVAPLGPADRHLGELDALGGTGDPGAAFARSIQLAEQLGAPLHLAYALASAAAFERAARGVTPETTRLAERARGIARPLGLERVLRMLPAASAAPDADAAPAAVGLTARETEVLRLLSAGLSNREIATELVISEHTAANHVRSILAKVGAPNRTRAARFAREHGLA